MEERTSTCDQHIERETLQVYLYVPRGLGFVGDSHWSRLTENGDDVSSEGFLRAWVRTDTVDSGCAAKFSDQVRKGPAGEEQHQAVVWKIPAWRVPVPRKTPLTTRPFGGESAAFGEAFQRSPRKTTNRASRELGIPQSTLWRILRKRLRVKPYRL